jgi:phosphoglycerol transferase MdoB-like AlkP superfamily enzyme
MLNKVLYYDTSKDYEAERVPFVIYNTSLKPKVIRNYTSYINIVPTVANLFDLDYDPRLYMGTDIFSEDYNSLTVFADGSWKNEKAFYNAAEANIKYYSSEEYTVEELQKINTDINLKIEMSALAIKNNYYAYLQSKLEEKEEAK